jgi:hypothetical protein
MEKSSQNKKLNKHDYKKYFPEKICNSIQELFY